MEGELETCCGEGPRELKGTWDPDKQVEYKFIQLD